MGVEQPAPRQHQIGKAEQREQLRRVLGQSPVADFAMTEEVLHHVEGVLDLGPNTGFGVFDPLQQLTQWRARQSRFPPRAVAPGLGSRRLHWRRCPPPCAPTPRLRIDANMRLHAEMPRLAFLRLVHLGIPILFPVLG